MTQWIITFGILALAAAYAIRRIILYFRKNTSGADPCSTFKGDCAQCVRNSGYTDDCTSINGQTNSPKR